MKSNEVKIFAVILVVALVVVGWAIIPTLTARGPEVPKQGSLWNRAALAPATSPLRGDPKAPTTIVVFSDFQCPSCQEAADPVDQIVTQSHGKINQVFRHYQAVPTHQFSRILARAAEAAGKQKPEKFWEMHDILFATQKQIIGLRSLPAIKDGLHRIAQGMKLDLIAFDAAMAKADLDKAFDEDNVLGKKLSLTGTPTFFVIDPKGAVDVKLTLAQLKDWARTQK